MGGKSPAACIISLTKLAAASPSSCRHRRSGPLRSSVAASDSANAMWRRSQSAGWRALGPDMASKKSAARLCSFSTNWISLTRPSSPIVEASFVGFLQGGEQATETGGGAGAAQDGAFQVAGAVAELDQLQPASRQGVLEQGQQAERVGVLDGALRGQAQIGADGGIGQRTAAEVVDGDVPALERGGDAAGEVAVRRDQGGGAAGDFQRLPHHQGDDGGFFLRGRAVDPGDAVERRFIERIRAPAMPRSWRLGAWLRRSGWCGRDWRAPAGSPMAGPGRGAV